MAKNYFNRYVWLIDLINRYGYIPLAQINRMWHRSSLNETGGDIPERTFFNHLKSIKETFGITIKCDRSLGYYISNEDELHNDNLKVWMLQSLSINNILTDSFELRDRILFEETTASNRWLTELVKSMRDSKKLTLVYNSYTSATEEEIEIAPYCLKQFKQRWYVLAATKDGLKVFALDRIREIKPENVDFELPEDFDAREYFSDFYGITHQPDAVVETVEVKMSSIHANFFRALNLHASQQEILKNDEYSVFRFRLIPNEEFMSEILSHGADTEILKPVWLREKMRKEVLKLQNIYQE